MLVSNNFLLGSVEDASVFPCGSFVGVDLAGNNLVKVAIDCHSNPKAKPAIAVLDNSGSDVPGLAFEDRSVLEHSRVGTGRSGSFLLPRPHAKFLIRSWEAAASRHCLFSRLPSLMRGLGITSRRENMTGFGRAFAPSVLGHPLYNGYTRTLSLCLPSLADQLTRKESIPNAFCDEWHDRMTEP